MSNSEVYFGVRSKDLTKAVRRVFGDDIVKDAVFLMTTYGDITGNEVTRLMENAEDFEDDDDLGIEIPTAGEILVEFNNGTKVEFSTSEWGFINRITKPVRIFSRNEETPNC